MPENHEWVGFSAKTPNGFEYLFNLPTEEVFSAPHKHMVNGTLVSSMPLSYGGKIIEGIKLEFVNGRVINYTAKQGKEILDNLFESDGAMYLGEIALVPHLSSISKKNTVFYKTLIDENASCHFAFGNAYPYCLKDYFNLTKEQLENSGLNKSSVHIDFMIGTKDLSIIGIEKDGSEVQIFKDGDWAF